MGLSRRLEYLGIDALFLMKLATRLLTRHLDLSGPTETLRPEMSEIARSEATGVHLPGWLTTIYGFPAALRSTRALRSFRWSGLMERVVAWANAVLEVRKRPAAYPLEDITRQAKMRGRHSEDPGSSIVLNPDEPHPNPSHVAVASSQL